LNLGCGLRFHTDWENLDFVSSAPGVRAYDLRKGIPFSDSSFDVVYHSHVLEHFSKRAGSQFLKECHRVLKSGGILRVAVPDLEQIARFYVEALDKSVAGDRIWQTRYEWILLEMYDQAVREYSGGEMLAYCRQEPIPERDFVECRLGGQLRLIVGPPSGTKVASGGFSLRRFLARKMARLVIGREGVRAHELGKFRSSGEVHLWMYDRYSLARALEGAGFRSPRKLAAAESAVPSWAAFNLDTEPDGSVYKPDSLYMEAVRP
jgi:predicted SAM-dependent methyltransferase